MSVSAVHTTVHTRLVGLLAALEAEVATTSGGAADALDIQSSDGSGDDELAARGGAPPHALVAINERMNHELVVLLFTLLNRDQLIEHLRGNQA